MRPHPSWLGATHFIAELLRLPAPGLAPTPGLAVPKHVNRTLLTQAILHASPLVALAGWRLVSALVERFDIEAYSDFSSK